MFFAMGITKYGAMIAAGKAYATEEECFEHFEESLRGLRSGVLANDFDRFAIGQIVTHVAETSPPVYSRIALVDGTAKKVEEA